MLENTTIARMQELRQKVMYASDQYRLQLARMLRNCDKIRDKISQEDVICRRYGRDTPRVVDLKRELDEALNLVEQYLMIATLMS
jgi:hypothetical protein